eukprot:TRINITY_DN3391_c0_g1_i3.p1 TRINITY_DN3391_c0_g1~~TRINITY_DN3391_c0_g1_i3.p1  ORF type:complete len:536 (+),score=143.37 TRINITY_DN3391_c0_g1_i3:215-1822(+)
MEADARSVTTSPLNGDGGGVVVSAATTTTTPTASHTQVPTVPTIVTTRASADKSLLRSSDSSLDSSSDNDDDEDDEDDDEGGVSVEDPRARGSPTGPLSTNTTTSLSHSSSSDNNHVNVAGNSQQQQTLNPRTSRRKRRRRRSRKKPTTTTTTGTPVTTTTTTTATTPTTTGPISPSPPYHNNLHIDALRRCEREAQAAPVLGSPVWKVGNHRAYVRPSDLQQPQQPQQLQQPQQQQQQDTLSTTTQPPTPTPPTLTTPQVEDALQEKERQVESGEREEEEEDGFVLKISSEIPDHSITLIKELGSGSYGIVHAGECFGSPVAIKVPRIQHLEQLSDADLNDLKMELEIMINNRHPNLVMCLGACTAVEHFKIILELLDGDLETLLVANNNRAGLSLYQRMLLAKQTALGMNWLHSVEPSVIHRDLKLENLLYKKVESSYIVKISDFGLAVIKPKASVLVGRREGTMTTMAPEIMIGADYDTKADVYSFAACLWQMVTCKMLYSHQRVTEYVLSSQHSTTQTNIHLKSFICIHYT